MKLLLAFALGIVTDVVWACWAKAVEARRPYMSATLAVIIIACGIALTRAVVDEDGWAIAAFAAGAWIGTFAAVRYGR